MNGGEPSFGHASTNIAPRWGANLGRGVLLQTLHPAGVRNLGGSAFYKHCTPLGCETSEGVLSTNIAPRWGHHARWVEARMMNHLALGALAHCGCSAKQMARVLVTALTTT